MPNVYREIKVFISSRCVGDYSSIRRELYDLLESSVVFEPFMFEECGATSSQPKETYLRELIDSDVCIFIIRNGDGFSEGVLEEIDCAFQHKKKSFFYLCGFNDYPEELEKRIPKMSMPVMQYKTANLYDVPQAAFRDLQMDVLNVYRGYCNDAYTFDTRSETLTEIPTLSSSQFPMLSKNTLGTIDATVNVFRKFILGDSEEEREASSELDKCCADLAQRMLFDGGVGSFDWSHLVSSIDEMIENKEAVRIIELRWKAIVSFFKESFQEAIDYLAQAYELVLKCNMPDWFITDLLIDLRNVDSVLHPFSPTYQKLIDENDTIFSYPVLDRENASFYSDLDEAQEKDLQRSIYAVTFGNSLSSPIEHICRAFTIAAMFGSFAQLLQTRKKLETLAVYLCRQYGTEDFGTLLLKLLVLSGDGPKVERMVQAMGDIDNFQSSHEAFYAFENVSNCAIPPNTKTICFEAFSRFGTSMKDSEFLKAKVKFMAEAQSFEIKDYGDTNAAVSMIKAIRTNAQRLDAEWSLEQYIRMMQSGSIEVQKKILEILSTGVLEFEPQNYSALLILIESISDAVKTSPDFLGFNAAAALAILGKKHTDLRAECITQANECLSDYNKRIFDIEICDEDDGSIEESIVLYIEKIEEGNVIQGGNGLWFRSGMAEYQNAASLIESLENPSNEIICRAARAALGTLKLENRLLNEKADAYILLMHLLALPEIEGIESIDISSEDLLSIEINGASAPMTGDNESLLNLSIDHEALLYAASLSNAKKLEDLLMVTYGARDYDKARAAKTLRHMLKAIGANNIDGEFAYFLYPYALALYSSQSFQVRIVVIELLLEMLHIPVISYDVARHLINSYEIISPNERCRLIRHQHDVKDANEEAWLELRQKSLNDLCSITKSVAMGQFSK